MRKYFKIIVIVTLVAVHLCMTAETPFDKYGRMTNFQLIDDRGDERQVQVFIPHNISHEVPAKVVWYFRGTNGIPLTWSIETTKLYTLGYDETAVIVAPGLYQKLWSKGRDETDYYLVKEIMEELKSLKDDRERTLSLDLENMLAIGFSAGGGFIYHLAGRYPMIFNEIVFRKYIDHARDLKVTIHEDGSITGVDEYDVQAVRDLIAAYEIYPDEKPPFLVSVGDQDNVSGPTHLEMMRKTRDILEEIGFEAFFYIVPGLHHRFYVDYTPEFNQTIKDFLFPVHITKPVKNSEWRFEPGKEFEIKWTSKLSREKLINIDFFSHDQNKYVEIAHDLADSGSYTAVLDGLPIYTGRSYIRITTDDHMDIAYSGVFNIIKDALNLVLQATLKEDRAWVVKRFYGEIDLTVENVASGGPFVKCLLYRKELGDEYRLIKEIPVEAFQNGSYSFFDKYLTGSGSYTYKAEALDINGMVLATSQETNLLH